MKKIGILLGILIEYLSNGKKINLNILIYAASLIIGIFFNNVPTIRVGRQIDHTWSHVLRNMALGIILGEAGVEVDKAVSKCIGCFFYFLLR